MTDRELAAAARHALDNIEDERELTRNALLLQCAGSLPYETLRSVVLRALESLEPAAATGRDTRKQSRLYAILLRCDLGGELHKSVTDSMGLSRRQFYRERHEALLRLAAAIPRSAQSAQDVSSSVELGDAAQAVVEALRSAGQYQAVWREASQLAVRMAGERRETKFWIVASEAARYLARPGDASAALERARHAAAVAGHGMPPYSLALWTTIGEMNLQWAAADYEGARAAFERAVRTGPGEHALYGDEAVLFGIMLGYSASMELDCGRWERARTLLARARRLSERGGIRSTGRFAIAGQSLLRLSAQLVLRSDGDLGRSIADHQAALDADHQAGQLGSIAMSAAYYAAALGEARAQQAAPYAEYGLTIARRFYPGDRLAKLTVELLPVLLQTAGCSGAREAVAAVKREGLGLRDLLLLDLAEAKVAAHSGAFAVAIERAEAAAAQLAQCGMHAWACDAQLIAVEASAKLGHRLRAARRLSGLTDALTGAGRAESRAQARRLGTLLAHSG